jgi:hypothetical protein
MLHSRFVCVSYHITHALHCIFLNNQFYENSTLFHWIIVCKTNLLQYTPHLNRNQGTTIVWEQYALIQCWQHKEEKKERGWFTLVNVASFRVIFLPNVHQTKGSKIKVLLSWRRVDPLTILLYYPTGFYTPDPCVLFCCVDFIWFMWRHTYVCSCRDVYDV